MGQRRTRPLEAVRAATGGRVLPPVPHALLRLQRQAGNRAVAGLVHRQEDAGAAAALIPPRESKEAAAARQAGVAEVARRESQQWWKRSVEGQVEYGAVIFQRGRSFGSTPARTSKEDSTVDIGQHEANAGCPPGTMPVGYWHTHPLVVDPSTKKERPRLQGDEAFSSADVATARNNQFAAFVRDMYGFHALSLDAWFNEWTFQPWNPAKVPSAH